MGNSLSYDQDQNNNSAVSETVVNDITVSDTDEKKINLKNSEDSKHSEQEQMINVGQTLMVRFSEMSNLIKEKYPPSPEDLSENEWNSSEEKEKDDSGSEEISIECPSSDESSYEYSEESSNNESSYEYSENEESSNSYEYSVESSYEYSESEDEESSSASSVESSSASSEESNSASSEESNSEEESSSASSEESNSEESSSASSEESSSEESSSASSEESNSEEESSSASSEESSSEESSSDEESSDSDEESSSEESSSEESSSEESSSEESSSEESSSEESSDSDEESSEEESSDSDEESSDSEESSGEYTYEYSYGLSDISEENEISGESIEIIKEAEKSGDYDNIENEDKFELPRTRSAPELSRYYSFANTLSTIPETEEDDFDQEWSKIMSEIEKIRQEVQNDLIIEDIESLSDEDDTFSSSSETSSELGRFTPPLLSTPNRSPYESPFPTPPPLPLPPTPPPPPLSPLLPLLRPIPSIYCDNTLQANIITTPLISFPSLHKYEFKPADFKPIVFDVGSTPVFPDLFKESNNESKFVQAFSELNFNQESEKDCFWEDTSKYPVKYPIGTQISNKPPPPPPRPSFLQESTQAFKSSPLRKYSYSQNEKCDDSLIDIRDLDWNVIKPLSPPRQTFSEKARELSRIMGTSLNESRKQLHDERRERMKIRAISRIGPLSYKLKKALKSLVSPYCEAHRNRSLFIRCPLTESESREVIDIALKYRDVIIEEDLLKTF